MYDLSSVAVAVVFPLIKKDLQVNKVNLISTLPLLCLLIVFQSWDMLAEPTLHMEVFTAWKGLLCEHEITHGMPTSEK